MANKKIKVYSIIVTIIAIFSLIGFGILFFHGNYDAKILMKLGLKERTPETNWAVLGWTNTLEKLNYDADIVFFGDSITRGSDFQKYFPSKKIVNLGYSGDSIVGMTDRIPQIKAVNPEKVFVLGGINGLTDFNIDVCVKQYSNMLDKLKNELPDVEIIVQSVLPISSNKEISVCHNSTIIDFNSKIEHEAAIRGMPYIDINSLYQCDSSMNPKLTIDGIHLQPEAYDLWANALRDYIE